jgi:hypothetical protein
MSTKVSQLPPLDERQRYTINEVRRSLRVAHSTLYKLISNGDLRSIKEGSEPSPCGAFRHEASVASNAASHRLFKRGIRWAVASNLHERTSEGH